MKAKIFVLTFFSFLKLINGCIAQPVNNKVIAELAKKWAAAETQKDTATIRQLYAPSVMFYGKKLKRAECLNLKQTIYKKYIDYRVSIVGPVRLTDKGDFTTQADFTKEVKYRGKTQKFDAYLTFYGTDAKAWITEEGDRTTDSNLAKMKNRREHTVRGDFNGDGKQEVAILVPPQLDDDGMACIGSCTVHITFSDTTIPDIVINNCIDGNPANHGDLNENHTDEIGLLKGWFTSCWAEYLVFTLVNGKWEYAVKPFTTHCAQWDAGIKPIVKDKHKKGNAIIAYMELNEDPDFKVRYKSVQVR